MAFTITTIISQVNNKVFSQLTPIIPGSAYAALNNPISIESEGSATLIFHADGEYHSLYPTKKASTAIKITGATRTSWTCNSPYTEGTLVISNPTADVIVEVAYTNAASVLSFPSNFLLSTNLAIDTRLVLSKTEMLAITEAESGEIPAGREPNVYFCICKDDNKVYVWNKLFTPSTETGYFKLYEEIMDLAKAINTALADPTAKEALDTAIGLALPGAIAKSMDDPVRAQEIADAMFESEHFQVTVDKKIDLAIDLILAIESK